MTETYKIREHIYNNGIPTIIEFTKETSGGLSQTMTIFSAEIEETSKKMEIIFGHLEKIKIFEQYIEEGLNLEELEEFKKFLKYKFLIDSIAKGRGINYKVEIPEKFKKYIENNPTYKIIELIVTSSIA